MAKKYVEEMIQGYCERNPARFHMPGHKGKIDIYDVTEISATDDLNSPEGCFMDAQRALSNSYCSAYSFFMVNGATGAIQAMIKYVGLGSKLPILVSRNSHKSVLAACILFNIDTIILDDKFDNELRAFVFDEVKLIKTIKEMDISAVIVTSVDYFGRVLDLSKISRICKEKGILLLCDEAHGSHFHISNMLPNSALTYSDICVHSPHKTLSAYTQCAYIHAADGIDIEKLKSIIYSLQTSSPSFILINSMDDARYQADTMKELWENRIAEIHELNRNIDKIRGMETVDEFWAKRAGYNEKDITRIVIDVSKIGSGIEIGRILENEYDIFMEMYSFKYIVGILTPWDEKEWDERLISALREIATMKFKRCEVPKYPQEYIRVMNMQDTQTQKWEKVRIEKAANRVAAVSIGVYPPGVPLILPGEIINQEVVEYVQEVKKLKGSLFGAPQGYVNCVKEK